MIRIVMNLRLVWESPRVAPLVLPNQGRNIDTYLDDFIANMYLSLSVSVKKSLNLNYKMENATKPAIVPKARCIMHV